jgi:tetrahydromethanopterin S-methyltransferase subunit B
MKANMQKHESERLEVTHQRETDLSGSFPSRSKVGARAGFLDALENAIDVGCVIAEAVVAF